MNILKYEQYQLYCYEYTDDGFLNIRELEGYTINSTGIIVSNHHKPKCISINYHSKAKMAKPTVSLNDRKTYSLENLMIASLLLKTTECCKQYNPIRVILDKTEILPLLNINKDPYNSLLTLHCPIYIDTDIKNFLISNITLVPVWEYCTWCKTTGHKIVLNKWHMKALQQYAFYSNNYTDKQVYKKYFYITFGISDKTAKKIMLA